MKVTIIFDNTVFNKQLQPNWGFSALVEAGGKKILFDTGGSGAILLANMHRLKIDPMDIEDIFISHAHFDHTGGLPAFLEQNSAVTVWVPPSFRGVENAGNVIHVNAPGKLYDGIYSTGELDNIEQSLCVATSKGMVIIAGCSHPEIPHILNAAGQFGPVHGIIGGLHGNPPETLKGLDLICATHCTQQIAAIKVLYPENYIEGGAGKVIEI